VKKHYRAAGRGFEIAESPFSGASGTGAASSW